MLFIKTHGYCISNYFMLHCISVLSTLSILKGHAKQWKKISKSAKQIVETGSFSTMQYHNIVFIVIGSMVKCGLKEFSKSSICKRQ